MYYIAFEKGTKRVVKFSKEPLQKQPNNYYGQAEFYGELPQKYDYLTITNLQEKTRVIKEAYEEQVRVDNEKFDSIAYEIIKHPEETETYFVCDLVANFRPAKTEEQIQKQKAQARIKELKKLLSETDYLANKYAEGWFTTEEYAPIKAQRQSWRDEINELEARYEV